MSREREKKKQRVNLGTLFEQKDAKANDDEDDGSGDNHGDILSREMKDRAFGGGLIINCSSSCSNREIKSEGN